MVKCHPAVARQMDLDKFLFIIFIIKKKIFFWTGQSNIVLVFITNIFGSCFNFFVEGKVIRNLYNMYIL